MKLFDTFESREPRVDYINGEPVSRRTWYRAERAETRRADWTGVLWGGILIALVILACCVVAGTR